MECVICNRPVGGQGYSKFTRLYEVPERPIRIKARFDITYHYEKPVTICAACALSVVIEMAQNEIALIEDHD